MLQSLQFLQLLLLYFVLFRGLPKIKFSLFKSALVFGIDNALDDLFYDIKIIVDKKEVVLIDILDMFSEVTSLFVNNLPARIDLSLVGRTLLMFELKF